MIFILAFLFTLFLSLIFTFLAIKLANRFKILDYPDQERKIHSRPTPLLGGLAIFISFFISAYIFRDQLLLGNLEEYHWLGVFFGACFLVIGGIIDDKYNLKPFYQIIFPLLAIVFVLIGGVEIEKITNPFGGYIYFYSLKIFSVLIIILWLLGMMYTTKLLDGLDGLVSGITAIGSLIIFIFTMTSRYYQPDIGFAALLLFASFLGFLLFNWHPAKIFLGESGALLSGFLLGVLAIISGGKIAITLLVMGIPIMDMIWTIIRRLLSRKNPFKTADKKHLHHELLGLGLSPKKTVLIFYFLSLFFGISALFLQSQEKLIALSFLFFIMLAIIVGLRYFNKNFIK